MGDGARRLLVALAAVASVSGPVARARAADGADARLAADLARVAQRRVLFGHQSVGAGVVAAAELLAARAGAPLHVALAGPGPLAPATFGHAFLDRNGAPLLKLESFQRLLASEAAAPPDVAILKFCYVDLDAATDVAALFRAYEAALGELERRYPRTAFVHVTVPLTTVQGGWKGRVKRALGRAPGGFLENERREAFNALLRARYQGGALFDLARLEATAGDGATVSATFDGRTVLALDPASTRDGGHPDAAASERIARALVAHLAALP